MFDLTVMDFARWGMSHAVPRFRDTSVGGMNLMDRLCDRPEWIAPEPGREHHKGWHQLVSHPDARLMAAAPELLAALKAIQPFIPKTSEADGGAAKYSAAVKAADAVRAAINKAEGTTP
jgi:hypothetical protein